MVKLQSAAKKKRIGRNQPPEKVPCTKSSKTLHGV